MFISQLARWCSKSFKLDFRSMWNQNFQMYNLGFKKGRGTRDQVAKLHWIMEKAKEFQKKKFSFCFIDYAKAFDCVDHKKLWKILKELGISEHLTCLLRNLYASQEATVRTRYGTTDWFKTGKGVRQGCILSLCLFNSYTPWTSCKMPGWMTHRLETGLPGQISTTSDMHLTPP